MKRTSKRAWNVHAIIFYIALVCAFSAPLYATPGDLDLTLDGNGRLATDIDAGTDIVTDVAVQTDGKIVVVGISTASGSSLGQAAIVRYNADGSLDTTFSGDGKLALAANCSNVALALMGSRMVVAYYVYTEGAPAQLRVSRINSNGTLDTTFDDDGTTSDTAPENFTLGGVVVDNSFKVIVVGGSSGSVSGTTPISDWLLWRFSSTGSLDTGFSGDGRQQTDFGGNTNEFAAAVSILSNGAIVVGGTGNPTGQAFAVARYTTNGSLDTNWGGGDGKIVTDISPSADVVEDMKVTPDERIILAGRSAPGGVQTATIARYNPDGTPDTSFDGDGIVQSAPFGANVRAVDAQVDGKVIAVGGTVDFVVGRFNINGSADATFGSGGRVATDMNNGSDDEGMAVAIQRDRRIVVGGSTLNTAAGATRNFCVARYLPTNRPYRAPFDFDGDLRSDYGIFRPSNGSWWINRSTGSTTVYQFGTGTDRMAPADFTGDGKADVAVFRPSTGQWFILRSENSSFYAFPFGTSGDIPVPGDYDADGKADVAVYRPSTSVWYISQSSGAPTQIVQFGINGDQPVVADYDEDGRADIGIFRPGPGEWWIQRSTAGLLAMQFGVTGDKPIQGDYTGDGKSDIAIFRPSTGEWYIVRSDDFSFYGFPFGASTDMPAPADYDGDGRMDPTVVRGTQWFIARTTTGSTEIFSFGSPGDRPIPNAFVP